MKVLVTGAAGHLGEALMRVLPRFEVEPMGADVAPGPFVDLQGTIADADFARKAIAGVDGVIHAATLHKPHVATHSKQDFVDVNVTGTLNLLEAAVEAKIRRFVYTSTTSAFGDALRPPEGAPAAWIDEDAPSIPKNIYGATKTAAEDLCALFAREHGLATVVLRVSRFFPEEDDAAEIRAAFSPENAKANEFAYRRVDIEDAAEAHALALLRAPELGFGKFVISATTPFERSDAPALRQDAPAVAERRAAGFAAAYEKAGFRMNPSIDRIYSNARARAALDWSPRYDFAFILTQLAAGEPIGSDLARVVGSKGYHEQSFEEGPYPVA